MILESELDAILIAQEAGDLIGVLGMGTTALKFDGAIADYLIKNIPAILISLDNDQSKNSVFIHYARFGTIF